MDDTYNKSLRQKVEEELRKAMVPTKLIEHEGFRKTLEANLEQLNVYMLTNKRIRTNTLEECRKLIQMALRKSFLRLVVEKCADEKLIEIFGASTVESFKNSESTGGSGGMTASDNGTQHTDQVVVNTERLALKYPRRKVGTSGNCSPCNVAHGSAEKSANTLFKRRHEVFVPTPQPATYAEHKRMMLQLQEHAKKTNMSKAATNVPTTENNIIKSPDVCKQFNHTDQMPVQEPFMEPAPANEPPKLCNNHAIVGNKSPPDTRNHASVLPEAENKTNHCESVNECHKDEHEPSDKTNDPAIDNVEHPKYHKNKVHHRELHDLLSYTTEILPKLSRRKSISIEEETNMQLLKQFGITKKLQIILHRTDYGQIAQRTRSKSIDSSKYLESLDTAKKSVPVHNKITQRKEPKTVNVKKQPTATTAPIATSATIATTATTTKAKVTKSTARKSTSKPNKTAQSIPSSKQLNGIKNGITVVKSEEEKKLTNPNATTKKRTRRSPSPSVAKRMRTGENVSTNTNVVKHTKNAGEDSDEDEANLLLANVAMNRNPQPNNDPNVHCHSDYMEKCCLCSYNGEQMVRHYVYNHPKKSVYVSRVAPEQAQLIKADPFGISGKKAVSRYGDQEIVVFRCHFCDLRLSESQELWLDHISKHTGEYRYKCTLCPTYARLPIDRVTHHSVCTNPSMQLWHTYNFNDNHLYAYMCNKCNFVQVLFVNMKRHLREDHPEAGSIEIECTKFSLVNFNLHDEDAELPYGMVKLEPILDDTNAMMQENVKQEVEPTLANDCQTPSIVQPEVIFIKQEILTNDVDPGETNTTYRIAKTARQTNEEIGVTLRANERQESRQHLHSSSVRVKKLPGDILSKTENITPNQTSRNSYPVNGFNNTLKHNRSNAGSTDITNSTRVCLPAGQHTLGSSMVALQPWNGKNDADKKLLLKSKLTVPFLTAPYKCTVFNCGFYTNNSTTMSSHFQSHQKPDLLQSRGCDSSWLECSYCNYASLSVQNLLKHIDMVHYACAYQCDRCCYRSRDPNSVRVHQWNYHSEHDAVAKILCISRRQKAYNSIDRDIIMNELKTNVKPLKCSNCSTLKFNDLEHYRNHIKAHGDTYLACHVCDQLISANKMVGHISLHNMFMLQCVYCDYGINDTQRIKKHVADNHSDKLLCYHIRCSKPNVPPFVRVQDSISPERFINC